MSRWRSAKSVKTAFLALGSNLGDRLNCLTAAVRQLEANEMVRIVRVSSVYETPPVGVLEQPDFLNLVLEVRTDLSPERLLDHALSVEAQLGRVRRERWGPRTIDIDLLWYEGVATTTPMLTLPHPRLMERAFVVMPFAEIAPQLLIGGQTIGDRAIQLGDAGLKKRGPLRWANSSEDGS